MNDLQTYEELAYCIPREVRLVQNICTIHLHSIHHFQYLILEK